MHIQSESEENPIQGDEPSSRQEASFGELEFHATFRDSDGSGEVEAPDAFQRPKRAGGVWIKDIRFNSIQEAACALSLEIYVPSFQIRYEEQYEIPIRDHARGTRKSIDFLVEDTFVEYHPPRRSRRAGESVQTTEEYRSERLRIIAEQPELRGRKLIVAENPEQFYEKVISRFALELPSKGDFMSHYRALCRHVSSLQGREAA